RPRTRAGDRGDRRAPPRRAAAPRAAGRRLPPRPRAPARRPRRGRPSRARAHGTALGRHRAAVRAGPADAAMNRRRRGIVLGGLALALGALAASDVAGREAALERRVGPAVDVVVARRALPEGRVLAAADLAV